MDKDNSGFTILELLIGLSVFTVVGGMLLMLLGTASEMYRRTVRTAGLQEDGRRAEALLREAVMEASFLYLSPREDNILFFAGKVEEETEDRLFKGTVFFWDREEKCLYYGKDLSIQNAEGNESDVFPYEMVKEWMTDQRNGDAPEKIEQMTDFQIAFCGENAASPGEAEESAEKIRDRGKITVRYAMRLSAEGNVMWEVFSGVTARNLAVYVQEEINRNPVRFNR